MYRKVRELRGSLQSAPVLVADIGVLRVRGGPTKATASVFFFCVMLMFLEVFGKYGAHFLLFFFLLTEHVR